MSRELGRMRPRLSGRDLAYELDGVGQSRLLALGVKGNSGIHELLNQMEARGGLPTGCDGKEVKELVTHRGGRDNDRQGRVGIPLGAPLPGLTVEWGRSFGLRRRHELELITELSRT